MIISSFRLAETEKRYQAKYVTTPFMSVDSQSV